MTSEVRAGIVARSWRILKLPSAQAALHERHLKALLMHDRAVSEVTILPREHVGIVRLAKVQEVIVELVRELHFPDHSREVVVMRHELVLIEITADERIFVEYRHRYLAYRPIADAAQHLGQRKVRQEAR